MSGTVGLSCARHMFALPNGAVDLQTGEGYVFSTVWMRGPTLTWLQLCVRRFCASQRTSALVEAATARIGLRHQLSIPDQLCAAHEVVQREVRRGARNAQGHIPPHAHRHRKVPSPRAHSLLQVQTFFQLPSGRRYDRRRSSRAHLGGTQCSRGACEGDDRRLSARHVERCVQRLQRPSRGGDG